jgi:hypothetical protein
MKGKKRAMVILLGFVQGLSLWLASCAPPAVEMVDSGPRAWVGAPRDGSELPPGAVPVLCHAFARAGVARVELLVNGGFAGRFTNSEDPGATYLDVELGFQAAQAGIYALQCRATDQQGATGVSDQVMIEVAADVKLILMETQTPSSTSATEESPTSTVLTEVTPTSTAIPAVIATSTSLPTTTPTSTPTTTATTAPAPRIASFEVSRNQITAGECVRFNWRVEGSPTEIYFDGEGVTSPDARDRCPGETTTYTLRAMGPGGEDTESLVVEVTQPPEDTEGPTIGTVSHSPQTAYCSQSHQVQISARVTDGSGVASVELYCALSGGMTQPKQCCGSFSKSGNDWLMTYDPQVLGHCPAMTMPVEVRYWIRAVDASPRGNEAEWGPGSFSVNL